MAELENNVNEVAQAETTEKMIYADRVAAKKASMKPGFGKAMYSFFTFIVIWFIDFFDSFKRNPIKIGAWMLAIPGIFIGFLMNFEIDTVYHLTQCKYAPICMFILILSGMINIFEAFSVSKNKNFGSILIATILTLIICGAGVVWIYDVVTQTHKANQDFISANYYSFITVGVSMALSVAGCVVAWINMDKTYKKDKF